MFQKMARMISAHNATPQITAIGYNVNCDAIQIILLTYLIINVYKFRTTN